ncbi:hypothetical protein DL98DRAFT_516461 [Cadophora sp. DSE1049]|nr:hypothetical protein DL98DRAFT_516461 [Cadophora sp. DSE1049]
MPPSLEPLSHCLLDIIWEFCMYGPYLPCSPSELEGLRSVISVLFAAVKFQAAPKTQSQSDQLIAQSLICLRSCLEASRVKDAVQQPAQFEPRTHNQCLPETCVIDCIASVNTNISLYNKELSRVFFSKENMRDKKPWWLSTFYSLYIQSLVKRTLRILEKDLKHSSPRIGTTYLQLPLRLFVASMGSYDPILVREIPTGDASTTDNGGVDDAAVSAYEEARLVLGQATWSGRGIRSSADYLCMLFEDDGMPMVTSDSPTHRSADEDIKLGESTHIEVVTS